MSTKIKYYQKLIISREKMANSMHYRLPTQTTTFTNDNPNSRKCAKQRTSV